VQFDAENYAVTLAGPAGAVTVSVFDKVAVHVEVEKDRNTQRGRVKMSLAAPVDSRGM
jgi:exosome complex exonuclease DIS3/RRP44